MTAAQFNELLLRLAKRIIFSELPPNKLDMAAEGFIKSTRAPMACTALAAELWRQQIPEDDDTRELRRQMNHVIAHAQFDYTE